MLDTRLYFTNDELKGFGFTDIGKNVLISRKCSFYHNTGYIGNNVRIDDFCIIKGNVSLYDYVHLSSYCMISGIHAPVVLKEFVGVSARLSLYSGSDDHSADSLGNSCTPKEFSAQVVGPVTVGLGTLIGAHCVILPNLTIGECASIGSNCIVARSVPDGAVLRARGPTVMDRKRDVAKIKDMARKVLENRDGEV